jgi:NTP pyrophosphatase (non-canonical NTP hydrolase)
MQLAELSRRALEIRSRYAATESAHGGKPWSRSELAQGFAGDVGVLMKLVMAKDGRRAGPPDLDARLAHELADCLWSVLVLADACGVDLEAAFATTMNEIEAKFATAPQG